MKSPIEICLSCDGYGKLISSHCLNCAGFGSEEKKKLFDLTFHLVLKMEVV